ncbi:MAG TPA: tetratricopeptide repeat protein [Candidatus Acidoferrum sp.]|jgi:hypothetical protein
MTLRNGQALCDACLGAPAPAVSGNAIAASTATGAFCSRCGAAAPIAAGQNFTPGQQRFCAPCHAAIAGSFPPWLVRSLVALLALLVVALIHGRKYFDAGRLLYRGEQLVEAGKYNDALPYLQGTLKVAPNSDKAVLLTAKAALLTGNFGIAAKALTGHNGGKFEDADTAEFREVDALWERANGAMKDATDAQKLGEETGKSAEAASLMHKAAAEYPEMKDLSYTAEFYDGDAAFERKDYDAFLKISERSWKEVPTANSAAQLATALACKYAITGNAELKQRSEVLVAKALQMSQGNAESTQDIQEFAERNNYRLKSREIITKAEYDKRFRSGKTNAH